MPDAVPTFETREEVMFFDTDCGGVVHNLAYLRMIETCRTRLAALMGMDLRTMSGNPGLPGRHPHRDRLQAPGQTRRLAHHPRPPR